VESTPLVHENIRGGVYFDRGETTTGSEEEEIEARYLEEERQSIIHEPRTDTSAGDAPCRRQEVRLDEVSHGVASSTAPARTESLSTLIARAQAALSGPHVVKQIGRREADARGGDDTQSGEDVGSSCTSQSACVVVAKDGEDESSREGVDEGMTCEVDEGWDAPCGPRRGEV
jgi:hypothetical protein